MSSLAKYNNDNLNVIADEKSQEVLLGFLDNFSYRKLFLPTKDYYMYEGWMDHEDFDYISPEFTKFVSKMALSKAFYSFCEEQQGDLFVKNTAYNQKLPEGLDQVFGLAQCKIYQMRNYYHSFSIDEYMKLLDDWTDFKPKKFLEDIGFGFDDTSFFINDAKKVVATAEQIIKQKQHGQIGRIFSDIYSTKIDGKLDKNLYTVEINYFNRGEDKFYNDSDITPIPLNLSKLAPKDTGLKDFTNENLITIHTPKLETAIDFIKDVEHSLSLDYIQNADLKILKLQAGKISLNYLTQGKQVILQNDFGLNK